MNTLLIKAFNAALSSEAKLDFATVNKLAASKGYLIHPDACTKSVVNFLNEQDTNPNATFYKTWEDVTSKSRFELFIDQILHYMTTYGTDFSIGNGYVPNDGVYDYIPECRNFKVIKAITDEELFDRCLGLIQSGIALKDETTTAVCDYIIDYMKKTGCSLDVDAIKNKEALIKICDACNVFPNDKFNLLRYIIFKTTGNAMIIKNRDSINAIIKSRTCFDFSKLTENQIVALSSIFLRFKPLFLAFKHTTDSTGNKKNAAIINRLRKLAVKNHTPMTPGFWDNIFATKVKGKELLDKIEELTNYKKVSLMQSCINRASALENQIYLVRNQKMFLREGYKPASDKEYNMYLYTMLRMSLINSMKDHVNKTVITKVTDEEGNATEKTETMPKIIRIPKGLDVALPTSEKSFIGNYPYGTTFDLTKNNLIGIYWKNEWGTHDFDLSVMTNTGSRIGWNSDYYSRNGDIVFSGDMTNAEPEAAEVIMFKNGLKDMATIKVNQYNGITPSKFRLYFGQEKKFHEISKNYMVDPNCIKLETEIPVDARETTVGIIHDDKIVLMAVKTGNKIVCRCSDGLNKMMESIAHQAKCFIKSADILKELGYFIVDETYDGEVDIDFTRLDKDSLISLMA